MTIYSVDVTTDSLLIDKYNHDRVNHSTVSSCEGLDEAIASSCYMDYQTLRKLEEIPAQLTNEACFNYSLAFVLLPIIGFAMDWFSSKKQELRIKVNT